MKGFPEGQKLIKIKDNDSLGAKFFLCALIFFGFVSIVNSEQVISISFTVYDNDSAEINHVKVLEGRPTDYVNKGHYLLEFTDENNRTLYYQDFAVNYLLLENPPVPVNYSVTSLRVPYNSNMSRIHIFKDDKLIYSSSVNVCDSDGICDKDTESFLSCPKDCPLDAKDEICIKRIDGICDPDCFQGIDTDCVNPSKNVDPNESSTTLNENKTENAEYFPYIILLIILAICGAVIIIYKRRQSEKIQKQREDFIRWKEEQERLKTAGKPPI
jgi:hypothetical protein